MDMFSMEQHVFSHDLLELCAISRDAEGLNLQNPLADDSSLYMSNKNRSCGICTSINVVTLITGL